MSQPIVKFEIRHGMGAQIKLVALKKEIEALQVLLANMKCEARMIRQELEELRRTA